MNDFYVRFWGVRGSIACPGSQYVKYGGNTSCVEVKCGDRLYIFDAGTGLRPLGNLLLSENAPIDADIFLSHTHMDHIAGIPFFRPAFLPQNTFRFWAGHLIDERPLKDALSQMMSDPLFPVPLDIFQANMSYHNFQCGEIKQFADDVILRTGKLNHPNGATGYRLEYRDKSICYVTDTEHYEGRRDPNIMTLVKNADIMIYDASYTDEEYPNYKFWGHSTWEEGVRLADEANVQKLVIFHHDPSHDDAFMDRISAKAEKMRPGGVVVAQEGMVIEL
jgi:phosphoribosyl 1,2-cyclic phosphodiesterase